MLLAFIDSDVRTIILWVVLVCAALGLIGLLVHTLLTSRKAKKNNSAAEATADGENATVDDLPEEPNDVEITELVMSRNVIYSTGIDGQLKAGKYVLESADDASAKFNVRVNGLVREYSGGDTVTLASGDTLSPVSGSVIITAIED